jgi:acetoin:2,6-dichlorophenolindophenol oxidoreductase subunit alpha
VDGQDVVTVYSAAQRLVEHARSGEGPGFLVCNTYRYYGHHVGDINRTYYRSKEEEEDWKTNRDPVKILAAKLTKTSLVDGTILEDIENKVKQEIVAGAEFAIKAPYPPMKEVSTHVYA